MKRCLTGGREKAMRLRYTGLIDEYIETVGCRINIQIAATYDEVADKTRIYLATRLSIKAGKFKAVYNILPVQITGYMPRTCAGLYAKIKG